MSPAKFWDLLRGHDWWYDRSDNHTVWRKGATSIKRITALANADPELQRLFRAYSNHVFRGEVRPDRPAEPITE